MRRRCVSLIGWLAALAVAFIGFLVHRSKISRAPLPAGAASCGSGAEDALPGVELG